MRIRGMYDGVSMEQIVNGGWTGTSYVRVKNWSALIGRDKGTVMERVLHGRWMYSAASDKEAAVAVPISGRWQNPFGSGYDGTAPTALGSRTIHGVPAVGFTNGDGSKVWVRRTGRAYPLLVESRGWTYTYSVVAKPIKIEIPDQKDTISWADVKAGRVG